MISIARNARNLFVQNVLKKGQRGDHLTQLRCLSKSYQVSSSSDYLKKNGPSERFSDSKSSKTATNMTTVMFSASRPTIIPNDKNQEFMSYFPDFVRELKETAEKYESFGTGKHLDRVLQYNVPHGKKNRGIMIAKAYELMAPKSALTKANIKLSMYLGWCVEMMITFMFILDDIMDESLTRRGQPCWYKVEDIGLSSINDALILQACVYQILKDHFSHLNCYVKLLELFHGITFVSTLGQCLDTRTKYEDVLSFTMEKYKLIVTYKTFINTFYTPIASAMYLAGNTDHEELRQAKIILKEICYFFQTQNDIVDCFGDPEVPNGIGTDIQNNTCTWLAVKCLERANEAQKSIMKKNYGKNDEESIRRVKQLYEELSLPEVYQNYEEETCNILRTKIQQNSLKLPLELYLNYLTKLQKQEL